MAVCAGAAWEIWPTAAAFVFSFAPFTALLPPPPPLPPTGESRKTAPFPPGVDAAVSAHRPRPLLPRLGLTAAGQSQRLFAEACFDVTTDS